jgi:DnaJ family protein A protein 5
VFTQILSTTLLAFLNVEQKAAMEMRAVIEKRKLAEQRAERVAQAQEFSEQDWMRVDEAALEASLEGRAHVPKEGDDEDGVSDDNEEVEEDEYEIMDAFYCVACEKDFKSEKQFKNHENSKKHIKNLKQLKRQILKEEREMSAQQVEAAESDPGDPETEIADAMQSTLIDDQVESDEGDEIMPQMASTKKRDRKKKRNVMDPFGKSADIPSDDNPPVKPTVEVIKDQPVKEDRSANNVDETGKKSTKKRSKKPTSEYL